MGTKQLLLIVLGVIIVGTAIAVSAGIFDTQFSGQMKEMAILKTNEIGILAKTYRAKPQNMGGGGGSYVGFNIPKTFQDDALSWKYDFRIIDEDLNFYILSVQRNNNMKPFFISAQHKDGELVFIKLFDPQKNKWETLLNNNINTNYTNNMEDI
ncbi:MAG: hypothetical protein PF487_14000 [Bacteroidales bacterium]|jgi:hypothetical protein|nr:hypothetical protein [Bacteroidales bacterium]